MECMPLYFMPHFHMPHMPHFMCHYADVPPLFSASAAPRHFVTMVYRFRNNDYSLCLSLNPLKRSGVKRLHFKVFNAIHV